jgi:hypothetical protein
MILFSQFSRRHLVHTQKKFQQFINAFKNPRAPKRPLGRLPKKSKTKTILDQGQQGAR